MTFPDTPLQIALIAELRSTYHDQGYSEEECAALPHNGEVNQVLTALQELGHHVTLVPGIKALVKHLAAGTNKDWDLAFNIAQGCHGLAREAQVPALLDAYQVPYTFSDAATMALCQNKVATKIILAHHKIPTAPFAVISRAEQNLSLEDLTHMIPHYPLFLKPVTEGSSKGIDGFNKVMEPADLESAVKKLRSLLPDQDILVEPFLSGREFSVSILGTGALGRVIGVTEFFWKKPSNVGTVRNGDCNSLEFASRKSKSSDSDMLVERNDPGLMTESQVKAACQVALDAWKTFGCRDAGRVDIRLSSNKPDAVPNVLEHVEAKVFATCSAKGKRGLLVEHYGIKPNHIFGSRSGSFAADIMPKTNGKGVDVILNSLSGPLLKASWVAWPASAAFRCSMLSSFNQFQLTEYRRRLTHAALSESLNIVRRGVGISPVHPITPYPISEMATAMRKMQGGMHMGKLVLVPHDKDWPSDSRGLRQRTRGSGAHDYGAGKYRCK
ncbi:hypothetical protein CNMCM8927_004895 [Aspergillus lentulus]|uniref:ATP-grasp domain-containing protein n=1 Tax=Aspergillus lentulus TaxID=293939 RepID=A0AAN5YXQ3_ASPLE|nr:hypothetical protein CNMCM8060_003433 [Aspergillus lentulus]KAF4188817.1 hypothetical protein CNMCM7927_000391 [Aspergillus lentulus]KAF4196370.1 hypothetical protein CNMCM8694_004922 [Aspergillus lentulus]KAF4209692.1 hypothetical protein CNMCM8927_004895 [Aspergillus lentulus]